MSRKPRQTVVPDRTGSLWPLGDEALHVAAALRAYGADPAQAVVPGVTSDEERTHRIQRRSPRVRIPLWLLDLAAAILAQIPERTDRPAHRPRELLLDQVELFATVLGLPKAALFVAELEAYAATERKPSPLNETEEEIAERELEIGGLNAEIKARAVQLLNSIYKRRQRERD